MKEIADMFSLKIRTVNNIISRAEKEGRLDLKGSSSRPKKVTQRDERKIIKTVYDSPQAIQYESIRRFVFNLSLSLKTE